jgi:hypothetical protein
VDEALGFLQLCADRRYHRKTMEAFELATGLRPDQYWIEARAGGAPAWSDRSTAAKLAYRSGARHMGWAAHGDQCAGFPGESNEQLGRRVERTARARREDFPQAVHYLLFGEDGEVEASKIGS